MKPTGELRLARRLTIAVALVSIASAWSAAPVISNVRAALRAGTQVVDVYYDRADPDSSALKVSVAVVALPKFPKSSVSTGFS